MSSPAEMSAQAKAKGNEFFQKGDFDQAIKYFSEAIQHDPKNHILYSNRSGAYTSKKNYELAQKDADQCIQINDKFIKGYSRMGAALQGMNKFDEAKAAYQRGLTVDPANQTLKDALADCESAQANQNRESDPMGKLFGPEMWNKLLQDPVTRQHMNDQSFVAKMQQLQRDPKLFASMTSDPKVSQALGVLFGIGSGAFQNMPKSPSNPNNNQKTTSFDEDKMSDDEEEEINAHTKESTRTQNQSQQQSNTKEFVPSPPKSTTQKPKSQSNLTPEQQEAVKEKELGNTEYKAKNFDQAIVHYKKAIDSDPKNIVYYNNLSAVYVEKKDFTEAISIAKKGIEIGQDNCASYKDVAKAYGRIGNCHLQLKQYEQAIQAFNKSLIEAHDDKIKMLLKKTEEVRKTSEAEQYLNPELSEQHKLKGNEFFQAAKWVEAIQEYTEALKRNPKNYKVYSNRAACFSKLMDWQRALDDCESCLKQDPKFVKAYIRKGKVQHFLKQYHKALETFDAGLLIDPQASELMEAKRATLQAVNTGEADPERAQRAMQDPEIRQILQDPVIQQVLQSMQENPQSGQKALQNPDVRAKIEKLVAAGVLQVK